MTGVQTCALPIYKHYYSAPYSLIHVELDVRLTESTVELFHKTKRVAAHVRSFQPGKFTTLEEHRPKDIMNTRVVRKTFRLLPADSVAYRCNPPLHGRKTRNPPMAAHLRWADAMNDPQWGWRVAMTHHASREPLPASLRDPSIRRAFRYLEGARDEHMAMAHALKDVARLAGLRPMEDEGELSETMLADMERTIAANARMLALAGHLNRKESPGIRHGKTLMMRPKPEAIRQQADDDKVGLGSFGMRAPVLEHFRRISDVDTQYRLALQRQQLMQEQDAATKKPQAQT